ncbi:hypothetical protein [Saccharothrix variisporea]|uniref:Uncharacterized protein n=1 Tax=Saccharothrix variisporea TaxID=543527 RepID=A0A495X737_9PSEU|nr:hypothetical protein [Saccharothrix variisporea]RKT69930.1 hypothetical protein DFJ66_3169 [Saccharothrix variisporea]
MSVVHSIDLTVTHNDVLYVSQQIQRDLLKMSECYPHLLSYKRITELNIGISTLLINDAVHTIGFSIHDPADRDLVYHELRYTISYTGVGPRGGVGGATITKLYIPATARFSAWVRWSSSMRALPVAKQKQVVAGTTWGVPGSSTFTARYEGTTTTQRSTYMAGALVAEAEEIRRF